MKRILLTAVLFAACAVFAGGIDRVTTVGTASIQEKRRVRNFMTPRVVGKTLIPEEVEKIVGELSLELEQKGYSVKLAYVPKASVPGTVTVSVDFVTRTELRLRQKAAGEGGGASGSVVSSRRPSRWLPSPGGEIKRVRVRGDVDFCDQYEIQDLIEEELKGKTLTADNEKQLLDAARVRIVRKGFPLATVTAGAFRQSNAWTYWLFPPRRVFDASEVLCAEAYRAALAPRYPKMRFCANVTNESFAAVKTVIAPFGSELEYRALAAGKHVVALANQKTRQNITLGWWYMTEQMGAALVDHPAVAGLPHDGLFEPLFFRIGKEGLPLPVKGFAKDDFIMVGEGGKGVDVVPGIPQFFALFKTRVGHAPGIPRTGRHDQCGAQTDRRKPTPCKKMITLCFELHFRIPCICVGIFH